MRGWATNLEFLNLADTNLIAIMEAANSIKVGIEILFALKRADRASVAKMQSIGGEAIKHERAISTPCIT